MTRANAQKIWQKVCDQYLESEINVLNYKTWFLPIEPILGADRIFILSVPNEITKEHVEKYLDLISNALELVSKVRYQVQIEVGATEQSIAQMITSDADETAALSSGHLNPNYSFDSFVVGAGNRFAHAACVAVATLQGGRNYNPLFLYGGSGLGKTHLMHAIGNHVMREHPDKQVVYVQSEQFVNEFIRVVREGKFDEFRAKYRMADMLLLDDVQFFEHKEQMQNEFFHTFNALYESGKNIVLTCDKPPQSLTTLEERLKTRFASGLTIDITPPDYETRVAILHRLAQTHHATITDDVFDYIATHIASNIRELEGAFKTVLAYSILGNGVNLEGAQNALKDIIQPTAARKLDKDLIIEVVTNYFSVTADDLKSKKRSQDIVVPRHIAMYFCRTKVNMTLEEIGNLFGGRDHTSVRYAYDKIIKDQENDEQIRRSMSEINARLGT